MAIWQISVFKKAKQKLSNTPTTTSIRKLNNFYIALFEITQHVLKFTQTFYDIF